MTTYICKCGRKVLKRTNADNTGNRDTAGCTGCPYLLPWGPYKYIEGQGYTTDVQGYECRMSPTISYITTYRGRSDDKCTLHILSLDLDFLDNVQAWIYDNAADTLSAGFSRGSMRGTDFSDKGRYSLSISCVQNKKGMAAKAALLEHFFGPDKHRLDMFPEEEKARILAAIKKGKENASKMKYTISEHQNGLMYAYYKGRFWFWHDDQNKWVPSAFAVQQYEKAKAKDSNITPEMLLDNGSFIILEEYQVPLQRRTALEALTPADIQAPAPDDREVAKDSPATAPSSGEAPEIVDECSESEEECPYLQSLKNSKKYSCQCSLCGDKFVNREICNKSFRSCGWYQDQQEKDARQDNEEETSATDSCQCRTCEYENCFAHGCAKECPANAEESCLTTSCPEFLGKKPQVAENPTQAAPASPADAGAATQSLSAAEPASLEVESAPAAFDYSALDLPTRDALHWAENEIRDARRDYIARLAQAVYIAHDALCATGVQNLDTGKFVKPEDSFHRWCESVGIKRSTAYNLLQVQMLLSGCTAEEQDTLEAASPSLLYAAAKPSAPAELVQAVKDGDITTHKQYQEALAEIRTRDAKIKELLEMSEESDRRADEAGARAKAAEKARDEACRELDGARQAFQAAKLRGDKLKEQLEASKDQVIEARVVDREEVERLAQERAAELTAPLRDELEELRTFRQNQDAGQVQRDAYDAFILAARIMDNTWQALRPQAAHLAEDQRSGAKNLLLQKLMEIKEDVIHVC